ncbi:hypothetical protein B9Z55_021693 [Caenorhabditis nigoni]|uniref:Skp1-related protein n=1 Tax=Caenorhabditis nigoni TaxID=1611254 RepID=A0A2G5TTN7_9PELO|nr:hypothetical protein B9Z55_021693 [Caenorhabditis nigoni]
MTPKNDTAKIYALESSDGKIFHVDYDTLKQSETLADMVNAMRTNGEPMKIPFSNIKGTVLERIVEFCEIYKAEAPSVPKESQNFQSQRKPEFCENSPEKSQEFLEEMSNEMLFDVYMAANYLHIPRLLDYASEAVAEMFRGQSTDEMREIMGIPTEMEKETKRKEEREARKLEEKIRSQEDQETRKRRAIEERRERLAKRMAN